MRRQWYIGFSIILVSLFLILVMLHDARWFVVFVGPLVVIWIHDISQKEHTLLRNFPVLGHLRYFLEFLRPEIQQYFIANDEDERPYNPPVSD